MPTFKKNVELKRVNMNLPSNLVKRVDDYAVNLGVNSTTAYIILLNQALDQKDTMNNLPAMLQAFEEIKKMQSISNNKEDLED